MLCGYDGRRRPDMPRNGGAGFLQLATPGRTAQQHQVMGANALAETPLPDTGHRRVLVVDEFDLLQIGLRALLLQEPWIDRCLSATSADEACSLADRYEPHIALVDVRVGSECGLALCRRLRELQPSIAVLLMVASDGQVSQSAARGAGAIGIVSKRRGPKMLVGAVHRAAVGKKTFLAPAQRDELSLTSRELDVLRQIAIGRSNPEAGRALHLSPDTVKQYTSSLYRKLGARNRADAVRCAQRLGLLF